MVFLGDPEASFTKEQMHAGKHQEYEKKLHDALLNKTAAAPPVEVKPPPVKTKPEAPPQQKEKEVVVVAAAPTTKDSWPQLEKDKVVEVKKVESKPKAKSKVKSITPKKAAARNKTPEPEKSSSDDTELQQQATTPPPPPPPPPVNTTKINIIDDNSSFFSQNTFQKLTLKEEDTTPSSSDSSPNPTILSESLPVMNITEDWEAAFGFTKHSNHLEELASQRNGTLLDTLTTKTAFVPYKQQQQNSPEERLQAQYFGVGNNGCKWLDYYKNGYTEPNSYMLMQQKRQQQLEEYFSVKQHGGGGGGYGATSSSHLLLQQQQQQNGVNSSQFLNFDGMYQTKGNGRVHAEDELDFDPFQETQKGLAELLENEQNHKMHSNSTGEVTVVFAIKDQRQHKIDVICPFC